MQNNAFDRLDDREENHDREEDHVEELFRQRVRQHAPLEEEDDTKSVSSLPSIGTVRDAGATFGDAFNILTRLLGTDTRTKDLEVHVRTLEDSNNQHKTEITSLREAYTSLTYENQELRQLLQSQQERSVTENQQLDERLENEIKTAVDSRATVNIQLQDQLTEQQTTITDRFNECHTNLQQESNLFRTQLTETEQKHHEEILTLFRGLQDQMLPYRNRGEQLEIKANNVDSLLQFRDKVCTWSKTVAGVGSIKCCGKQLNPNCDAPHRLPQAPELKP